MMTERQNLIFILNILKNTSMLTKIQSTTKQILKDIKIAKKCPEILKNLIESVEFESWMYLDKIIEVKIAGEKDKQFQDLLKKLITQSDTEVKSFPMFVFIYSLVVDDRLELSSSFPWKNAYHSICVKNNEIIIFNSWVFNSENHQENYNFIQNTLQLIAKTFSVFLKTFHIQFSDVEFDSIIKWVLNMQTETPEKFQLATNLATSIRDISVKSSMDYILKEHLILKKLIQNLGDRINNSGNVFLLLQSQKYQQKDINYFCHIYYDFLTDLNENHICNVFENLVIGGMKKEMLLVILKFSSLLQSNQQFFKLRFIHQNFIIPIFSKAKAHKEHCELIFNICEFYSVGFLRHCDIGVEGINYILEKIQKIENKSTQEKWIELSYMLAFSNNSVVIANKYFERHQVKHTCTAENIQDKVDPSKIWEITLRSGKKHKKYAKINSNFRGIQNKSNQCYMISVVQALFTTQFLQKLVDEYRKVIKEGLELLDELRILFSELDGQRKADNILVTYLKKKGPQNFRIGKNQEDSMQYLIELFNAMEGECMKHPQLLAKFKSIFQIDCKSITKCGDCGQEIVNIENQYIHTIPHTKILQLKVEEDIEDYACTKCKNKKCKNIRIISPQSQIFIVHINRFTHKNGKPRKEISNQTILRKFKNYELVGMICHIGKNVENGHYLYFSKVDGKKWVEMNDKITSEFELENQDEQFEGEMKVDMPPYILFYRRIN